MCGHSEHTLCCIMTASYPAVSSHSVHQHNAYIIVSNTHMVSATLASHVVIIELWTVCYFYIFIKLCSLTLVVRCCWLH